jgi:CBS domain-containing membrane protein
MRAGDLMSGPGVRSVAPEDSLAYAAEVMTAAGVRHLAVLRGRELVGILSERDLLRRGAELGRNGAAPDTVANAMIHPPRTIGADEPVGAAAALMFSHRIGCLPVVDGGVLVGMLTTSDILRHELYGGASPPRGGQPLPVGAVMRPAPPTLRPETALRDAARVMANHALHHITVVDGEHRVVGLLTSGVVRRAMAGAAFREAGGPGDETTIPVGEVMVKSPLTVEDTALVSAAVERLVEAEVDAAPVVDAEARLVGMLSFVDLAQHLR